MKNNYKENKCNYSYILKWIGEKRRISYLDKIRKNNKNMNPSIIANNCVGGIIYHDLGLKFSSPTINLFIKDDDYFEFLSDLKYYTTADIIQVDSDEYSYPVGIIKKADKAIMIHFLHYKTFEDAKYKWVERCKRIDFNNLFVIFEHRHYIELESSEYKKFKGLKYKNKIMITNSKKINDDEVISCKFYKKNYYPGKILEYPHWYSKKRLLNKFNYVKFLNKR